MMRPAEPATSVATAEDVAAARIDDRFTATNNFSELSVCDVINVCVPTPLTKTKDPDVSYIVHALEEIRKRIHAGQLVILGSTTYPGTTRDLYVPMLEATGLKVGEDFCVAFAPERIDPANAQFSVKEVPKVVGGETPLCTDLASKVFQLVFDEVVPVSSTQSAEMVKLLENTFRAINIGLANEVALMCDRLGLDVWEVIDAAATKPYGFMKFVPGPGLGGHCIPVDPTYLAWKMKSLNFPARFIELATEINGQMPRHVTDRINDLLNEDRIAVNGSTILVLGVAYKSNVSDVRESPALDIIRLLTQKGAEVSFSDPHVRELELDGVSLKGVDATDDVLKSADLAVITTQHAAHGPFEPAAGQRGVVRKRSADDHGEVVAAAGTLEGAAAAEQFRQLARQRADRPEPVGQPALLHGAEQLNQLEGAQGRGKAQKGAPPVELEQDHPAIANYVADTDRRVATGLADRDANRALRVETTGAGNRERFEAQQADPQAQLVVFEVEEELLVEPGPLAESGAVDQQAGGDRRADDAGVRLEPGQRGVGAARLRGAEKVGLRRDILHDLRPLLVAHGGHGDHGAWMRVQFPGQRFDAARLRTDVVVEQQHSVVARLAQRSIPRGARTAVAAQLNDAESGQALQRQGNTSVGRAVVDEQNLVEDRTALRHGPERPLKVARTLIVDDRHADRAAGHAPILAGRGDSSCRRHGDSVHADRPGCRRRFVATWFQDELAPAPRTGPSLDVLPRPAPELNDGRVEPGTHSGAQSDSCRQLFVMKGQLSHSLRKCRTHRR